jgi:FkbM family methyltransferase
MMVKKVLLILKDRIRFLEIRLPTPLLISLLNFENWIKTTGTRLKWDKQNGLFQVMDSAYQLQFCRKERSILYTSGVSKRIDSLARTYFQNEIPVDFNGTFIDCGANVGELSLFVVNRYHCKVLAFEPEPMEYQCLLSNLLGFGSARAFNKALWEENKELNFYSSPQNADSSLIPSEPNQHKIVVRAITLDSLLSDHLLGEKGIILKIEAEGAEPEVIRGGRQLLKKTEMVLVDGGPERGFLKEKTEHQNDLELYELGFDKLPGSSTRCQVYKRVKKDTTNER